MPKIMEAALVPRTGEAAHNRGGARPEPKENQILVHIAATGICHTDLHAAKGN